MVNKNIKKGIAFLLILSTIILAGDCGKKPNSNKTGGSAQPGPKLPAAAAGTQQASVLGGGTSLPPATAGGSSTSNSSNSISRNTTSQQHPATPAAGVR